MNSMSQAVSTAVTNPIPSKTSRREVRKSVTPVAPASVQAPVAAPVVSTPKPKVQAEPKPEVIFTISDRAKLEASKYASRLTAFASDPKVHRDHTTFTLAAILSLKKLSFTLTDVIAKLDRPGFEGAKPKSDKLLRAYVADCVSTLENFGISHRAAK